MSDWGTLSLYGNDVDKAGVIDTKVYISGDAIVEATSDSAVMFYSYARNTELNISGNAQIKAPTKTVYLWGKNDDGSKDGRPTRNCIINIEGGTVEATSSYAIYLRLSKNNDLNISGGTIQDGHAGNSGGNIAAYDYTKLTISGGTIQNGGIAGKSDHYGGNIRVYGYAELEMTGGTIKDGYKTDSSKTSGKDIGWRHANLSTAGTFTMTGGSIEGRTFVNAGTANISGDAYIFGVNALSVKPAADLTIGALNSGAKLGFMCTADEFTSDSNWKNGTVAVATAGDGLTPAMVANQMSVKVSSGTGTYSVVLEDGKLFYRANSD